MGDGPDPNLGEDLCVTVIATGFEGSTIQSAPVSAGPKKVWLEDNDTVETTSNIPPAIPQPQTAEESSDDEPFLKSETTEESEAVIDRNKWDQRAPQKELFSNQELPSSENIPTQAEQERIPQNTLHHEEAAEELEVEHTPINEADPEVSTEEEFIIYNLDDAPEPKDLTPESTSDTSPLPMDTEKIDAPESGVSSTSTFQPSKETFVERQRQISRSLADFRANSICQVASPIWKMNLLIKTKCIHRRHASFQPISSEPDASQ